MLKKIHSISFLPVGDILQFNRTHDSVRILANKEFEKLKCQSGKTTLSCSPKSGDPGTLYGITVSSKLLHRPMSLMGAVQSGCIIRIDTADGLSYIYGCSDFPLRGSVVRNIASTAKDFSGFTLSLTGSQLHDALELID